LRSDEKTKSTSTGITNYIDVRSVDEYASKVERLGGKVMASKMPVKGMVILQFILILKIIDLEYGRQIVKQSDQLLIYIINPRPCHCTKFIL
jgi:hypothetical protein